MNEDKIVGAQAQLHFIWNAMYSKLSWEPAGSDASVPPEPEPTHKKFLLVCREAGREVKPQVSCYQPFPIRDAVRREMSGTHAEIDVIHIGAQFKPTCHLTRLSLKVPSSQRRLGPSPVQDVRNTVGWIPASAGMTNNKVLAAPCRELSCSRHRVAKQINDRRNEKKGSPP